MITLETHLDSPDQDTLRRRLLELDDQPGFGWRQRLYYDVVRPLMPIPVRQKLQKLYSSSKTHQADFIDDSLVNEIEGWEPRASGSDRDLYPDGFEGAIVLTHDVEELEGFEQIPKVLEIEEELGFKSSWNIIPYKHEIDEGILRYIRERGHEIGVHGYNHDGKLFSSYAEFSRRVPLINDALKRFGAVGFRSPQVHRNLSWQQELDVAYDASCFDYDPYQPMPGGTGFIWPFRAGKFIEMGYTLPQDHTLFYVVECDPVEVWKRKAAWCLKNRGMILLVTHPDYLVEGDHLTLYREFLLHLAELKSCWKCLPREMAKWWDSSVLTRASRAGHGAEFSLSEQL